MAAETARLDQDVKDGKLTQAKADAAKATLTQRITDLVNGKLPVGKGMPGLGGFPGRGPRGGPVPANGQAPTAPTTAAPAAAPSAYTGGDATTA